MNIDLANLSIELDGFDGTCTKVRTADGIPIEGIAEIVIRLRVGAIPEIVLTAIGPIDLKIKPH